MPILWLGITTFLVGALLSWFARRAPTLRRLGAGITVLGIGTLAMTQPGGIWIALSILCSTTAIVLIGGVLWTMIRSGRPRR